MGEATKIEWCDATFNMWIGCQHVSPGCANCFAETLMDKRYHRVTWGPHGERKRTSESNQNLPYALARKARREGRRFRVFCGSLMDWLDNKAPQEWRVEIADKIRRTPELDWLMLTKRPENFERFCPWDIDRPPANVWFGFTAEDQERFEHRWKIVREIPATMRFCSYEPAIGPLRLFGRNGMHTYGLHWLICGGESGPGYRPFDLQWEADIRRDCEEAGIAYFFKQLDGKRPVPVGFPVLRQFPAAA